jgi:hypothetical protein
MCCYPVGERVEDNGFELKRVLSRPVTERSQR